MRTGKIVSIIMLASLMVVTAVWGGDPGGKKRVSTVTVTSESYRLVGETMVWSVMPAACSKGSSPSYEYAATVGQTATDAGESESYSVSPGFFEDYTTGGCCGVYTGGLTGNANCSEDGKRTLVDITRIIDRVFISKTPLCCEENGNVNGDPEGMITLSDITGLIDHVFITKRETEPCQ